MTATPPPNRTSSAQPGSAETAPTSLPADRHDQHDRGSALRRVKTLVRKQVISQSRDPGWIFVLIALPVVDAMLFTTIGSSYGEDQTAEQILLTGILLFHLAWQLTLAGSLGLLEDVWERNIVNLLVTPLREIEYGLSLFIVGLIRGIIASALIGAVGLSLYALDVTSAGLVLAPAAMVLILFGWAIALFVVGMTLQFGESAEVFSWAILVALMPLSGVFYPPEDLPGIFPQISSAIPVTRVFNAVRTSLDGGGPIAADLWWAGIGSLVLVAICWAFVMFQLKRFRQNGWISRFM